MKCCLRLKNGKMAKLRFQIMKLRQTVKNLSVHTEISRRYVI